MDLPEHTAEVIELGPRFRPPYDAELNVHNMNVEIDFREDESAHIQLHISESGLMGHIRYNGGNMSYQACDIPGQYSNQRLHPGKEMSFELANYPGVHLNLINEKGLLKIWLTQSSLSELPYVQFFTVSSEPLSYLEDVREEGLRKILIAMKQKECLT